MPITPPSIDSAPVSTMNCSTMCRRVAPSARRMPISRVRSVTLASMMFMMPMPPTSSEMPATTTSMTFHTIICRLAFSRSSHGTTICTSVSPGCPASITRRTRSASGTTSSVLGATT